MKSDMTVHEREETLVSLEGEILDTLKGGEPIPLPGLLHRVAQANRCTHEDVAIAFARLSESVEQIPEGPTIMVRRFQRSE